MSEPFGALPCRFWPGVISAIGRKDTTSSAFHGMSRVWACLLCLLLSGLSAAVPGHARSFTPTQPPIRAQRGEASYLHSELNGNRTASGERYNKENLTAAHRTIPFGTVLRVTRLSNGRMVLVRVNDRGPYAENRLLDLSLTAAKKLNMLRGGVTQVQLEILTDSQGVPLRSDEAFYLVLATMDSTKKAASRAREMRAEIPEKIRKRLPEIETFQRIWDPRLKQYFVGMGPFLRFSDAQKALSRLPAKKQTDVICAKVTRVASR